MEKFLHRILLDKIVSHKFKIEDAEDAIKAAMRQEKQDAIKVVIVPDKDIG